MSRARTVEIFSLEHLDLAITAIAGKLDIAFGYSHDRAGENFASNDRASDLRLSALSQLTGLITPYGYVSAMPEGPRRPRATTWLEIPSALGTESVMVNCVEAVGGDRYKLTNGNVNAIPDRTVQPGLYGDMPSIIDLLLGIQWYQLNEIRRPGDPLIVRVEASLLGGHLDRKNRIFYAYDSRFLLRSDYGGHSGGSMVELAPTGPTPRITRS